MNELISDGATLSPLALQLQTLINQGVVKPVAHPENLFPSAMVVVPVYDSTGTGVGTSPFQTRELRR